MKISVINFFCAISCVYGVALAPRRSPSSAIPHGLSAREKRGSIVYFFLLLGLTSRRDHYNQDITIEICKRIIRMPCIDKLMPKGWVSADGIDTCRLGLCELDTARKGLHQFVRGGMESQLTTAIRPLFILYGNGQHINSPMTGL